MNHLIIDGILLVVLLLFALWGRHRGLILSVFSLVALLVAIGGGLLVSKYLTPAVTEWVMPMVEGPVVSAVQSALPEEAEDALSTISPEEQGQLAEALENLSPEAIQSYLEEYGIELPEQVQSVLAKMDEEDISDLADSNSVEELAVSAAEKVVQAVARVILFLLAFVVILILWHVLAHALDLVSRLPGLKTMNRLGGFLFGAVRGILFLFVIGWALQCYPAAIESFAPAETVEQTYLLKFFLTAKPLEFLASL